MNGEKLRLAVVPCIYMYIYIYDAEGRGVHPLVANEASQSAPTTCRPCTKGAGARQRLVTGCTRRGYTVGCWLLGCTVDGLFLSTFCGGL